MKTVRELIEFICHDDSEHIGFLNEHDRKFLSELMDQSVSPKIDKQSLVSALKKAKITGFEIETNANGPYADFGSQDDYAAALSQLIDDGKMYDLAASGWVATYCDDISSFGEDHRYRINFIEIGEVESKPLADTKATDEDLKVEYVEQELDNDEIDRKSDDKVKDLLRRK